MKLKILVAALIVSLVFSGFPLYSNTVNAETNQEKLEKNRSKQSEIEKEKKEKQEEIEKLKKEQEKVNEEIASLDKQVMEAKEKIETKENEIAQTKENIEQLKAEIAELEERIAERDELLKDRVKSMYQTGGAVDYLDVLMGAESFGNFLERVMSLNTIASQDKEILEQHKADKEEVEKKKAQVEEELASLEEKLQELETLKQELDQKKQEKNALMEKLEKDEEVAHNHVMSMEEEQETLSAQEAAIQKEIEREKERKRKEAEEARKRAAEKAAAEKKASASTASTNSSSSHSSSSSSSKSTSSNSGALFSWPANAAVTSEFDRNRIHPITGEPKLHSGIDLAGGGTIPISAAADGTVIRANYSSSYGNVVMISHRMNGQTFTTVYAHMRSTPAVSAGQSVSRGQFLGNMGSTGASTGQHLHFEIHEGSWNGSRSNSVNPRKYLP
ncbi:Murein DD-endopeptidase MepM and murein hydrolase activator NlpD, contain LysM domain [Halobacillus karajensis]|uniref:Peptidoglycan DL-endopeptidase CwlO n=1 Tax=Halobacillus karajensis TaxID=195088 RepID=A0A059NZ67_9BACI|nr:peptidoglycan DD-metalloendopeptidase family protein [Halobacillus karajensis]CDQ18591.1 Peptidoglycan DL-endopeptidase CwlO precursor [Halobacillus karajensis]CDQ23337.1 Peptidoglycan DL-endopeptidase CwlO precursor [Halobacillus karajensis]CDQ26819.1 Peptidoglycan DL-endopeptidase CwlO precursor [Halobacillus karajensis]SEH49468.1 Murein DD-endopeptidase MepM and murein hydrolase activator NlpD, contain LysM domain [Halobacillus karajensis]